MPWTTHQFCLFIRIHASFKNGEKRKGYGLDVSGTAAAYSLPKHGAIQQGFLALSIGTNKCIVSQSPLNLGPLVQ